MALDMNKLANLDKISTMEEFFQFTQPTGSIYKNIALNMFGINNNMVGNTVPTSRDSYGMAFFTRPQLNLSTGNLRNQRKLYSFLTKNPRSIHRYVRMMLDPRLAYTENLTCPFIDNRLAFIPILTNNLETMGGWPDPVLPTYKTPEGLRREQQTIADGYIDIYNNYSMDATFRNTMEEPIVLMMKLWVWYASQVFEGMLSPYIDMVMENEIDYNTRIYRLVLDETKRYVKKIACTGASVPVNVPMGKFFDYQKNDSYNTQNKTINIRFDCDGAEYDDDIIALEFNMTSAIFNPEIRKMRKGLKHNLEKIPIALMPMFNYRGYPYINLDTLELEWYVDKTTKLYQKRVNYIKN